MHTIAEVAARAGVSEATVSRVVNGSATVTAPTRARVVAAIEELAYRPNHRARNLSLGRNTTIAVLAPVPMGTVTARQLGGVAEEVADAGFELALIGMPIGSDDPRVLEDLTFRRHAAGLLLLGRRLGRREHALLERAAVPLVVVGEDDRVHNRVYTDVDSLGNQAVTLLRRLHHRRIALVSEGSDPGMDAAVRRELATTGGGRIRRVHPDRCAGLLRRVPAPSAVIASSDYAALTVVTTARAMGVQVPEELSVIGCGRSMEVAVQGITTVAPPLRRQGRVGANLLLELVRRKLAGALGIAALVTPVTSNGASLAPAPA